MRKNEVINGYTILEDFKTAGQSIWTFAERDGKKYFIKQFLSPTYPIEGALGSEKVKKRKRDECEIFEIRQRSIMKALFEKCSIGGNLLYTIDFFRHGSKYYKITDKVDVSSLSVEDVSKLDFNKKILLFKTISHSLGILHDAGIVHGDLKPDNVLIKYKIESDFFVTKLIDFDSSFFEMDPPQQIADIVGDQIYFSPEQFGYLKGDKSVSPKNLTTKSDIFTLGLIYCQYLTSRLPLFDCDKYQCSGAAVFDKQKLVVAADITDEILAKLINKMLNYDFKKRPSVREVFNTLKTIKLVPTKISHLSPLSLPKTKENTLGGKWLTERKLALLKNAEKAVIKENTLRGKWLSEKK